MSTPQDPQGQQSGYPYGYQGDQPAGTYGQPYPGQQQRLPGVLVASVVLWVLTGLFLVLAGLGATVLGGADSEQLQRQLDRVLQPTGMEFDAATVQQAVFASGVVLLVLGALLAVLALLMLGRQNWARILLTVLGVITLVLLLGTIVGALVVLLALVLHFLPPVNAWFKSRPRPA